MTTFPVKLPDVGEGVAEAELINWLVAVGDHVTQETAIAEVMTDKATVEISSPVSGVVAYLRGAPGDVLAVGSEIVGVELDGSASVPMAADSPPPMAVAPPPTAPVPPPPPPPAPEPTVSVGHVAAAPAVRARARSLGIDLGTVRGTGPEGRVVHADLDAHLLGGAVSRPTAAHDGTHVEVVRGLRKRIAERLGAAWADIPHITYVEAVDLTDLETLRAELNRRAGADEPRLTVLPFLARAMVIACGEQPRLNAHFESPSGALTMFDAVHIGIATQTADGLMVPVVRHAEERGLRDLAGEIGRMSGAARDHTASRTELSGSTITITSLGAMGGLVTTPLINQPEVAIVGVNKIETRPVWRNGNWEPRQMCNLSSSFDHRIVDGWDAATFVQRLKTLLEMPALLFIDESGSG